MNDDQIFLANAYLDGELTVDERAIAEADPDVMSEVAQLRAVQTEVRTVAAPSDAVREAAISAAMAQFRTAPAAAAAPAPRRVQFRPPPWYRRYLAVAAAVAAVGLLGVVIVNVAGRGDDDDSASISADDSDAGADTADAAAEAPTAGADTDGRDMVESDEGDSGDDAADEQVADLPPDAIAVTWAIGTVDPAGLPDEAALVAIGDQLRTQRAAGEAPASPNTFCVFPDVEDPAEILARTSFQTEAGPIELLVAVDDPNGLVYGIDPATCTILVEGLLP